MSSMMAERHHPAVSSCFLPTNVSSRASVASSSRSSRSSPSFPLEADLPTSASYTESTLASISSSCSRLAVCEALSCSRKVANPCLSFMSTCAPLAGLPEIHRKSILPTVLLNGTAIASGAIVFVFHKCAVGSSCEHFMRSSSGSCRRQDNWRTGACWIITANGLHFAKSQSHTVVGVESSLVAKIDEVLSKLIAETPARGTSSLSGDGGALGGEKGCRTSLYTLSPAVFICSCHTFHLSAGLMRHVRDIQWGRTVRVRQLSHVVFQLTVFALKRVTL